jgi:hypothetical protein
MRGFFAALRMTSKSRSGVTSKRRKQIPPRFDKLRVRIDKRPSLATYCWTEIPSSGELAVA